MLRDAVNGVADTLAAAPSSAATVQTASRDSRVMTARISCLLRWTAHKLFWLAVNDRKRY
jgi:hypothetical protein